MWVQSLKQHTHIEFWRRTVYEIVYMEEEESDRP